MCALSVLFYAHHALCLEGAVALPQTKASAWRVPVLCCECVRPAEKCKERGKGKRGRERGVSLLCAFSYMFVLMLFSGVQGEEEGVLRNRPSPSLALARLVCCESLVFCIVKESRKLGRQETGALCVPTHRGLLIRLLAPGCSVPRNSKTLTPTPQTDRQTDDSSAVRACVRVQGQSVVYMSTCLCLPTSMALIGFFIGP